MDEKFVFPFQVGQKVSMKCRTAEFAENYRTIQGKVIFVSERIFVIDTGKRRESFTKGEWISGAVKVV